MTYELEIAVRSFRARARAARAELNRGAPTPEMRRYLTARANQADAEATAMQQSVDAWREKELETEVGRAEAAW